MESNALTVANSTTIVGLDPSRPFFSSEEKAALGLRPYVKKPTRTNDMATTVTEYGKKLCTLRFAPDTQGAAAVTEQMDNLPPDATVAEKEFLTRKHKALMFAWGVGETMPLSRVVRSLIGATSTVKYVQGDMPKVGLSPTEARTRIKGLISRAWFRKCFSYETGNDGSEGLTRLAVNVSVSELHDQIAAEILNDALSLTETSEMPEQE